MSTIGGSLLTNTFNDNFTFIRIREVASGLQNNCLDAIEKLNDINQALVAQYRKPIEEQIKQEQEDYSNYIKEIENIKNIQKKVEQLKETMAQFQEASGS